jgi:colanic acid biosynthesis glycosyl transferase WcaI
VKRILIHTIVFSPDAVSTAYLYTDIAFGLKEAGNHVQVITTTPHYNVVKKKRGHQILKRKWLGLLYVSDYEGIKVYHIPAKKHKSIFLRLLSFIYFHLLSLIISFFIGKVDVVLTPSPPLTIGLVAILIAKLKGGYAIYNVQEIYPDFIINQRILKNKFIIWLLKGLERFVYKHSRFVVTIDKLFSGIISPRIKSKSKIKVIPNFVDTDLYREFPKVNKWSKSSAHINKFIVMYAGNIGLAQDWEPLIFAAQKLSYLPIQFVIIGEGIRKDQLKDSITNFNLTNISLLNYQDRQMMPLINAFADLHFIAMNPDIDKEGFPSKVYSIMASGRAIVVSTQNDTPLAKIVNDSQAGIVVPAKNNNAFADAILYYYNNPAIIIQHSGQARDFILRNYSKEIVVKKYEELIS